jgi:hypothetical protein
MPILKYTRQDFNSAQTWAFKVPSDFLLASIPTRSEGRTEDMQDYLAAKFQSADEDVKIIVTQSQERGNDWTSHFLEMGNILQPTSAKSF